MMYFILMFSMSVCLHNVLSMCLLSILINLLYIIHWLSISIPVFGDRLCIWYHVSSICWWNLVLACKYFKAIFLFSKLLLIFNLYHVIVFHFPLLIVSSRFSQPLLAAAWTSYTSTIFSPPSDIGAIIVFA